MSTTTANRIGVTAREGALIISPASVTGFLKPHLQYWRMHFPPEKFTYFDKALGEFVEGERRGTKPRFQKSNLFEERDGRLITHEGLFKRIAGLCADHGWEIDYRRVGRAKPVPALSPDVVRGLHDDQVDAVSSMLSSVAGLEIDGQPIPGGSGAIVEKAMGAGKTYVIAALCRAYGKRVLVTTRRKRVVHHLRDKLEELLGPDGISVGVYQGPTRREGDVVVSTSALLDVVDPDDWDVLIYDEVHASAGEKVKDYIFRFGHCVKFGLSGTVSDRSDGKGLLLEAMFGPIVYTLTDQEAEDLDRVVPLTVYAVDNPSGPNLDNWRSPTARERWGIRRNNSRNKLAVDVVDQVPDDQQLLIFVKTEEHGGIMMEELEGRGFEFYHGGLKDKEQADISARFESGELLRLISTDSLSEGVDPRNLMVVIDLNWDKSNVDVPQRAGRARRHAKDRDKPYGVLVYIYDSFHGIAEDRARARGKIYSDRGYTLERVGSPEDLRFYEPGT